MSHYLAVRGIKGHNEKFEKMMKLKLQCEEMKVSYPKELIDYFTGLGLSESMVDEYDHVIRSELQEVDLSDLNCCKAYSGRMKQGFEINVKDIPEDYPVIRVYIDY